MKSHKFWGKIKSGFCLKAVTSKWTSKTFYFAINKLSYCQLGLVLVIYVANSNMYCSENDEPYLKSTLMKTSKVLG